MVTVGCYLRLPFYRHGSTVIRLRFPTALRVRFARAVIHHRYHFAVHYRWLPVTYLLHAFTPHCGYAVTHAWLVGWLHTTTTVLLRCTARVGCATLLVVTPFACGLVARFCGSGYWIAAYGLLVYTHGSHWFATPRVPLVRACSDTRFCGYLPFGCGLCPAIPAVTTADTYVPHTPLHTARTRCCHTHYRYTLVGTLYCYRVLPHTPVPHGSCHARGSVLVACRLRTDIRLVLVHGLDSPPHPRSLLRTARIFTFARTRTRFVPAAFAVTTVHAILPAFGYYVCCHVCYPAWLLPTAAVHRLYGSLRCLDTCRYIRCTGSRYVYLVTLLHTVAVIVRFFGCWFCVWFAALVAVAAHGCGCTFPAAFCLPAVTHHTAVTVRLLPVTAFLPYTLPLLVARYAFYAVRLWFA